MTQKKILLVITGMLALSFVSFSLSTSPKEKEGEILTDSIEDSTSSNVTIRYPAVADQFYPEHTNRLKIQLDNLLAQPDLVTTQSGLRILFVPHAGLDYSGNTAAWGFKQLENDKPSRIILIGSSHNEQHTHAAVFSKGTWKTPLGDVEVDETSAEKVLDEEQNIIHDTKPHTLEHSLEMEVIFLQRVLDEFKIIPILVSQPTQDTTEALAHKIVTIMDDSTLLIVSTDLSHYPPWEIANEVDRKTINAILGGDKEEFEEEVSEIRDERVDTPACGYEAIKVALRVAEILQISDFKEIKYENSGDVTLDKESVVGYASIGAWKNSLRSFSLDEDTKKEALEIARDAITEYITNNKTKTYYPKNQFLYNNLGAFVTITNNDILRGCIGQHQPQDPLYKVIRDKAVAAATADTRFLPIKEEELNNIDIEISILTPQQEIPDWRDIELGTHGVVVRKGLNSGTFLPQVAEEKNWTLEGFLSELCTQKAGLSQECYRDPQTNLFTFEASVFEE